VSIIEITSGQRMATLKDESEVHSIAFSPDGKYVATEIGKIAVIWSGKARKKCAVSSTKPMSLPSATPRMEQPGNGRWE
jgi:hypothetical protein